VVCIVSGHARNVRVGVSHDKYLHFSKYVCAVDGFIELCASVAHYLLVMAYHSTNTSRFPYLLHKYTFATQFPSAFVWESGLSSNISSSSKRSSSSST